MSWSSLLSEPETSRRPESLAVAVAEATSGGLLFLHWRRRKKFEEFHGHQSLCCLFEVGQLDGWLGSAVSQWTSGVIGVTDRRGEVALDFWEPRSEFCP